MAPGSSWLVQSSLYPSSRPVRDPISKDRDGILENGR